MPINVDITTLPSLISMPKKVRENARRIAAKSTHVRINDVRISALADKLAGMSVSSWDEELHYMDGTDKSLLYILVLDAMNFCFWPAKFTVEYQGKIYGEDDGYCALSISLKKAFLSGKITDARSLAAITLDGFGDIMEVQGELPLLFKRLEHMRSIGETLLNRYEGSVTTLLDRVNWSAPQLARELADYFDAYKDVRDWKGEDVEFLKRAQICAADMVGTAKAAGLKEITGVEELTCFADYKLPQYIHSEGVFAYAAPLEKMIVHGLEIEEGSIEEIEIRANTIEVVERLKDALMKRGKRMSAQQIDDLLWKESIKPGLLKVPHHKTMTTSY